MILNFRSFYLVCLKWCAKCFSLLIQSLENLVFSLTHKGPDTEL